MSRRRRPAPRWRACRPSGIGGPHRVEELLLCGPQHLPDLLAGALEKRAQLSALFIEDLTDRGSLFGVEVQFARHSRHRVIRWATGQAMRRLHGPLPQIEQRRTTDRAEHENRDEEHGRRPARRSFG